MRCAPREPALGTGGSRPALRQDLRAARHSRLPPSTILEKSISVGRLAWKESLVFASNLANSSMSGA
jgi:hypothetical protein